MFVYRVNLLFLLPWAILSIGWKGVTPSFLELFSELLISILSAFLNILLLFQHYYVCVWDGSIFGFGFLPPGPRVGRGSGQKHAPQVKCCKLFLVTFSLVLQEFPVLYKELFQFYCKSTLCTIVRFACWCVGGWAECTCLAWRGSRIWFWHPQFILKVLHWKVVWKTVAWIEFAETLMPVWIDKTGRREPRV